MNPYRKHTEVYQDLVKLIETNLAAGRYFLPPETTMARHDILNLSGTIALIAIGQEK